MIYITLAKNILLKHQLTFISVYGKNCVNNGGKEADNLDKYNQYHKSSEYDVFVLELVVLVDDEGREKANVDTSLTWMFGN